MTTAYADEIDTSEMDDDEIDSLVEDIIADRQGNLPPELAQGIADKLVERAGEYQNVGAYRRVYSTLDGSPSDILEYMLPKVLKYRRVDNPKMRRFSLTQKVPWNLGNFKCELNPQHPMFPEYMNLGFSLPCNKATLRSELEVRRHMERKHKDEWRTRQDMLSKAREDEYRAQADEDRAFQRALMERLVSMQEGNRPRDVPEVHVPFSQVEPVVDGPTETITNAPTDMTWTIQADDFTGGIPFDPEPAAMDYDEFVKQDAEEAWNASEHAADADPKPYPLEPVTPWHEGLSNKQLRAEAESRGIKLSTKYISNPNLIKLIEES